MSGDPDPIYVASRRALLDALEALGEQRQALVLVGAHAIYLHVGEADIAVAAFTTDADIAIDPGRLKDIPRLERTLQKAGFLQDSQPGIWRSRVRIGDQYIPVDFLVAEALAGKGRRAAKLGDHGPRTARKVRGLEAAMVDHQEMEIHALEGGDPRRCSLAVAGPAALLVAKLHKIGERVREGKGRAEPKDALDVLRLLRGIPTGTFANDLDVLLEKPLSAKVCAEAVSYLEELFATASSPGSRLAVAAVGILERADQIAASCEVLATDLLSAIRRS